MPHPLFDLRGKVALVTGGNSGLGLGFARGMAHYGAAKGAMVSVMKTLAVELGPYGIRANMVAPGYIRTDLGRDGDPAISRATEEAFAAQTPLRRIAQPEDVEGIAAYLASDAASFHSGDVIVVDGGYLAKI